MAALVVAVSRCTCGRATSRGLSQDTLGLGWLQLKDLIRW